MNSETMTPITARVAETFKPANICGKALGSLTFNKIWRGVALNPLTTSNTSGVAEFRPTLVFITMGKKVIMRAIVILGRMVNPSTTKSIGAMAILGMTCADKT